MTTELRRTGIDIIGDMPWGTHFCHFFETKQDLLDTLIPYFKAGLEEKECCLWLVSLPLTVEEAIGALGQAVPDIGRYLQDGSMELLPHVEWFLGTGDFDLARVISGLREKVDHALARGCPGLRFSGNPSWLRDMDHKSFWEYERALDELTVEKPMLVSCIYPLAKSGAVDVFEVAQTHLFAGAMRHGKWEVVETPELKQTKSQLTRLNQQLERCVDERTRELAATTGELMREISSCKRAEEQLKKSEEELHTLFAAMMDVVLVLDAEGRYVKIAPTNPSNLYRPPEELLGKRIHEVLPREVADQILGQVGRVLQSRQPAHFEYKLNIGSREVWFEGRISPLTEDTVFWVVRDVTERKRAEETQEKLQAQFLQSQKMESVGRLAGGVAHDFNNMLGVILGHVEMALEQVDPTQLLHSDLMAIQQAANRSKDLTRQLLAFARKQTISPRVLDMNETIRGMLKMLRRLIGEDIHLSWLPGKELWTVKIDPSQIDQILANLCVNARDAIAGVGKVAIETGNISFDEAYCADHAGYVPGDYVRLVVSDNGSGMDKETLGRLFEPFFTTKEQGKGTGLGLATVYGIVKQNRGFINVYSEPGQGTTFRIYLPRHMGKAEQASPEGPQEQFTRGRETILVVEDEQEILNLTKRMLEKQGYQVLAAGTPGEAIRLAEQYTGAIHLLITDLVMPEMNGRDLAKNILRLYPNIRRLFMSGYTADVIAHQGTLDDGVHFIQKPFSTKELAVKVREALEGAG